MRYATAYPSVACQARSRRIGRCARCHAPVLSDEEHYGDGAELVHSACLTQPIEPGGGSRPVSVPVAADPPVAPTAPPRRVRRTPPARGLGPAFAAPSR